jgi:phage shock protein C
MTEQQPAPQQSSQEAGQHPSPPPQAPYRRLTRTSWDAPISGVCGGVARYLGVDPTVVRVIAAITMVVTFPVGPIVYAVMWAVMPRE